MLFNTLKIRDVEFKNRIAVSPMCQYSSEDGFINDWHLVHLGSRAVGGAGLVMMEATAVTPSGRITSGDAGIWSDDHIAPLKRLTQFIQAQGSVAGIQLAHAGRKSSSDLPWNGGKSLSTEEGGWSQVVAPSALAFDSSTGLVPQALTLQGIQEIRQAFVHAAKRAFAAGFKVLEIHAAHGYLLQSFLSPLSNQRTDNYGGSFENRIRFLKEVTQDIRNIWPEKYPLFVRISATDWMPNGWDIEQSVALAHELKSLGVDLIDCSSGGIVPHSNIKTGPGYQVEFAEKIKREVPILTGAVGLITDAKQAEDILQSGKADLVLMGRELLRNPYWPLQTARQLGIQNVFPKQYVRG